MMLWRDLEERAELAADAIAESVAQARLLAQVSPDGGDADTLRGRLARAFVTLGTRIDREAASRVAAGLAKPA